MSKLINPLHLWTANEYARKVNKSPQIVRYWITNNLIKTVKTNGNSMIVKNPKEPFYNGVKSK